MNQNQKAYNQLRDDITFGIFKPGEHLRENILTQKYGVSRATTREIIRQLATQGYLTVEPNRGAIVSKLSLGDVDIIYNILIRCDKEGESNLLKPLKPRKMQTVSTRNLLSEAHQKEHKNHRLPDC